MIISYILKNINEPLDPEPYIVERFNDDNDIYFVVCPKTATQYMSEEDAESAIARIQHSYEQTIFRMTLEIVKIYILEDE